ncbi:hypothetical protein JOF56_005312 [Kibdelosporangium banguiense]|uniref:Peptidase S1A alpha-lytic prodomain domain-containing protein n=1 Tax=Kibdelosporangium banguiense TaxID=1365924 RepID=A0ABS4TKJ2_9PSEU|nr:hypothetical protein [Kibdelosporangium banguiense]
MTGWYVDLVRDTVVVTTYGDETAAAALAGTSNLIQVERSAQRRGDRRQTPQGRSHVLSRQRLRHHPRHQ